MVAAACMTGWTLCMGRGAGGGWVDTGSGYTRWFEPLTRKTFFWVPAGLRCLRNSGPEGATQTHSLTLISRLSPSLTDPGVSIKTQDRLNSQRVCASKAFWSSRDGAQGLVLFK